MTMRRELLERAEDWLIADPDVAFQVELRQVIDAAAGGDEDALADLASRFDGPLTFGTAGLRGQVGAGESRMNTAVVIRATAGLARFLLDTVGPDAKVVVGHDARRGSSTFAAATVEVLSGAGLTALALPPNLPTPVTAFAVRALDADAGIMITASHNPATDNGYKVYLGGRATDDDGRGVQIISPADAGIAARIAAAPRADEVPRNRDGVVRVEQGVVDDYVARTASHRTTPGESPVRVVLTAMHGVGGSTVSSVFDAARIVDVHMVAEQFDPDPAFPTVAFPNPEEPGALDRSVELARKVDANVIVALDPDADRCSVAIPHGEDWRQLTGDEIGALLGAQAAADDTRPGRTLACSVVSSRLLGRIAAAHSLPFATTLTGFKWIARAPDLRFGYEEAIGYCTDPAAVRDKDGIGAAVRIVVLVETLAAQGRSLQDALDDLAREHGLHATSQVSFRVSDLAVIDEAMTRLRALGIDRIAGSRVVETADLAQGFDGLPPTEGLLFRTEADDRVVVRPSGTEPKLKCYLEVVLAVDGGDVPHAAAADRLTVIAAELTGVVGLG